MIGGWLEPRRAGRGARRHGLFEHRGGRVAYTTFGDGPPLFCDLGRLHHLDVFWRHPPYRRLLEALSRRFRVIQIDRPGCGLSDRSHADFTLPAELALFRRLLDHLDLEETAILAAGSSSQVMIATAAMSPEQVTGLVVFGARASGHPQALPYLPGLRSLLETQVDAAVDWLAQEASADDPAVADWLAQAYLEAGSGEVIAQWLEETVRLDVSAMLADVRCPTLVLHRRGDRVVDFSHGRDVAAGIPGATLLPLDGTSSFIWEGGQEPMLGAVAGFLSSDVDAAGRTPQVPLTMRQRELARLVALGLSNTEIAGRLGIGRRTVESHLQRLRLRLGLSTRAQLAAWSISAAVSEESPTA